MTGHAAVEVVERTEAVCAEHACRPAITLNMVENNALECVISMAFNRQDNGQTRRVRRCNRQLHEQLMEAGYMPCRVGLEYMDMITDTDDPFWQTVRGLKTTLDPDGILAPGRYECT
jgi:4-cresol dehydrogenase (hydroxylating)